MNSITKPMKYMYAAFVLGVVITLLPNYMIQPKTALVTINSNMGVHIKSLYVLETSCIEDLEEIMSQGPLPDIHQCIVVGK